MHRRTTDIEESAPPDVILSAIGNEHRRAILRSLDQTDGNVLDVSELTDRVVEQVRNEEPAGRGHRRRVRTALHHIHLPKLEDCGMIVYDSETKQVRNVNGALSQELLAQIAPYEA